jgi:hypothetical protein
LTLPRPVAVAQCKVTQELTLKVVNEEVERAATFAPKPAEYLIMTTAVRDAGLQEQVRTQEWPFRVHVMFWEDISLDLSGHHDLLRKHFPTWTTATVSTNDVLQRVSASTPEDYQYNDSIGELRFDEPWVRRFPDQSAWRQIVYVEYDGARVHTAYFVWVDGARYLIPYPNRQDDLRISQTQYQLGCILGHPFRSYSFDTGLRRAGIAVDPTLDPSATPG